VVILLASIAQSQEVKTFGELSKGARDPSGLGGSFSLSGLGGSFSLSYDKLKQGAEEYGEVMLYSSQNVFLSSPYGKDARLIPTRLEIATTKGLLVSPVIYPKAHPERFPFDSKPIKVLGQMYHHNLRFRFKVRSAPDLPIGDYVLKPKLSFQMVSDSGISESKELMVDVPITVVSSDAKVESVDRSIAGIRGITPGEWVGIVLLAPVSIPVGLFMLLIDWDGC
jgi:hypothetical protein